MGDGRGCLSDSSEKFKPELPLPGRWSRRNPAPLGRFAWDFLKRCPRTSTCSRPNLKGGGLSSCGPPVAVMMCAVIAATFQETPSMQGFPGTARTGLLRHIPRNSPIGNFWVQPGRPTSIRERKDMDTERLTQSLKSGGECMQYGQRPAKTGIDAAAHLFVAVCRGGVRGARGPEWRFFYHLPAHGQPSETLTRNMYSGTVARLGPRLEGVGTACSLYMA